MMNGAREGNWTLVTAIVVLSGLKWPDSLGNSNRVAGGFLHYLHSTKLSEMWPICTARNARHSGMFSIWTPIGRSTTNRPACAPMIQTFRQGDHMTILEQFLAIVGTDNRNRTGNCNTQPGLNFLQQQIFYGGGHGIDVLRG